MAAKHKIKVDPENVRIHDERNQEAIGQSLRDLGTGRSILIDSDNVVIGGNGVYAQAQELGLPVRVIESDGTELIAVKRTDLKSSDAKRKALAIADNRTSDLSFFDDAKLSRMLDQCGELNAAVGFTPEEIAELTANPDDPAEEIPAKDSGQGEIPFAEELLESHNYVVLYFNNSVDWLQAQTLFNLQSVKEPGAKPGYVHRGIGRVINGAAALNRILHAGENNTVEVAK
ncbi:MAG: hypothetical protein J5858_16610 [Lentisphaeria bacterium]|nr:hypothetical protein [Lentisphaeria bacterium]